MNSGDLAPFGHSLTQTAKSLGLLVRYEQALQGLYERLANRFPQSRTFWLTMAADEEEHAAAASSFLDLIRTGIVELSIDRFDRIEFDDALEGHLAGLPEDEYESGESYALSHALELEKTAVERKLFSILETDPPELANLFWLLQGDYEEHISRLMEHAAQVRGSNANG